MRFSFRVTAYTKHPKIPRCCHFWVWILKFAARTTERPFLGLENTLYNTHVKNSLYPWWIEKFHFQNTWSCSPEINTMQSICDRILSTEIWRGQWVHYVQIPVEASTFDVFTTSKRIHVIQECSWKTAKLQRCKWLKNRVLFRTQVLMT